jgi:membrane dipeptidase
MQGPVVNGLAQGGVTFRGTLEAAHKGGIAASNLTVASNHGFREAAERILGLLELIDSGVVDAGPVTRVADIEENHVTGRAGIILGFQNSDPIEGDLVLLGVLHRIGLRIMQLTYQRRNLLGSGCGEEVDEGLTPLGHDVVRECNRLGVLVDLSHTAERTLVEAAEASTRPVVISHANLRSFYDVPRNKSAEAVKAVAATGGLMGINSISRLITPHGRERQATIVEYVDQVEAVAQLVGIEHVGIGLDSSEGMTEEVFAARQKTFLTQFPELRMGGDFPLWTYFTTGLESAAGIGVIAAELDRRGWAAADRDAVMGGNWMRVLRASWNERD